MSTNIDVSKRINILQIISGDDETIPVVYLNPENDLAVDVSSFTEIIFTVRDKKNNRKLIEKKLSTSGIEYDSDYAGDGTDGRLVINIAKKDTHNLDGIFKYDLQFTDSTGAIKTPVRAFILIKEDITKWIL